MLSCELERAKLNWSQTKKENVYVINSLNCTKVNYTIIFFHGVPYIDPRGLKNIVIGWTESKVPTLGLKLWL